MKRLLFTFIVLLSGLYVSGQGHQVEVLIQDLPDKIVYLSRYYKTEYTLVDSIKSSNGAFYFYRSEDQPGAMYRLDLNRPGITDKQGNSGFIEFSWANESFKIYADQKNLVGSVFFENSRENALLGEFRRFETIYERKMSALYPLIDRYPEDDAFFREAKDHFLRMQEERDAFIRGITKENPGFFASKIISSYRSNVVSPDLPDPDRMKYLKQYFFDNSPINKPELLYAPVYSQKIIEYIKLHRNQNYSFSEQEDAFIQAVDVIMANVSGDPELRNFVVEFLLEGFQSFGMEKIQTYIVDTYVDETCETDAVDLAVERVTGYRKMAVGEVTADIFIESIDNEMVRLSEVDSEYTLVIFWATYCGHCVELMPEIREWYTTEKPANLELFSISIDTVKSNWIEYNKLIDLPGISTHEPMGWGGKSSEEYNIYATPTMFLLDRERKIIAKPYTFGELLKEVGKLM
jgi:thiol-disulfide isomerase/thioredoxin